MRKLYIVGLVALTALIIGIAWAEQITLSTYYPAPYGVYREMAVRHRMAIGDLDNDGDTDADDMAVDGMGDDIEDSLTVANSVGIGTRTPGTNRLMVDGGTTQTAGGLIIETRDDIDGDPPAEDLVDGRMWLRTDINP